MSSGSNSLRLLGRLPWFRRDIRAIAFVEFALSLPLFTMVMMGGIEIANFVTTKMRVSQLALHVADHIARIGTGSQLAAKTISEKQINDVLTGAGLQADRLNLYTRGRVIISSLEPDTVNTTSGNKRYKIAWQRCQGVQNHASSYGAAGAINLTGMGPTGQQVTAPDNGATIFVEVSYQYQPIINTRYIRSVQMTEIAAMPVRDRRDTTQIYNTENVTQHLCSSFTAT